MARKAKITRTIITTKANILCMDVDSQEAFENEVTLSGTFKNDGEILKAAKPLIESDYVKAVHVVGVKTEQTLYGMDEQKFIENAEILPPRKEKANDEIPVTNAEA